MAKKGFNTRNDELEAKLKAEQEARKAEMGDGESTPQMGIKDGLNVWWVVPPLGETLEPVVDMLLHYRPFHRCGRADPVPDASVKGGYKMDKSFGNCIRCQTAWDKWDGAGRPQGPAKRKFSADMENHQSVLQAFNLTPFFDLDSKGKYAKADKKAIKAYLDIYLEIVAVEDDEERAALGKEHLEADVPEDVVEAAVMSPGIPKVNKGVGADVREAMDDIYMNDEVDPTGEPANYLLQIIRTQEKDTFTGANGKEVNKRAYSVKYTASKMIKDWTKAVDQDALIELALNRCVDIQNIEPKSDSLQDRAYALEKLTEEEIEQLLVEAKHSYDFADEEGGDSEEVEEFSPDDFDEEVLGTDDHAAAEELKAQLAEEE